MNPEISTSTLAVASMVHPWQISSHPLTKAWAVLLSIRDRRRCSFFVSVWSKTTTLDLEKRLSCSVHPPILRRSDTNKIVLALLLFVGVCFLLLFVSFFFPRVGAAFHRTITVRRGSTQRSCLSWRVCCSSSPASSSATTRETARKTSSSRRVPSCAINITREETIRTQNPPISKVLLPL